jgi:hypothetical protein
MLMSLPIFVPDRETIPKAVYVLERETQVQQEIDRLRQSQAGFAKDLWKI